MTEQTSQGTRQESRCQSQATSKLLNKRRFALSLSQKKKRVNYALNLQNAFVSIALFCAKQCAQRNIESHFRIAAELEKSETNFQTSIK